MAARTPYRNVARTRVATAAAAVATITAFAVAALPAGAQGPPGNNGTVKIDRIAFDDHPNNEPHVGCVFQVDFYGYDEGDLDAEVTFEGVAPTGGGVLLTDTVFIGEDEAGGGTDLDASVTYDLTEELAGITPHPVQGHHVRLTVNAEGSQGADVKHKVFWVSVCDTPTSGPTSTTTTTTTPGGPPPQPPPGSSTTTTTTSVAPTGETTSSTSSTTTSTSVPAVVTPSSEGGGGGGGTPGTEPPPFVAEEVSSRPPTTGLAFTGLLTEGVVAAAIALVVGGLALTRVRRHRTS